MASIKKNRCQLFVAIIVCMLFSITGKSQFNYSGKQFFLSLPGSLNDGPYFGNFYICIFSKYTAHVQFYYYHTATGQNYTLVPGEILTIRYPADSLRPFSATFYEQIDDRSLEITSDSDIAVQAIVNTAFSEDATPLLPVDNQKKAKTYFLIGYRDSLVNQSYDFPYPIVATCDSTVLRVTPTANTYSHAANIPFTITLNKGETYQIGPRNNLGPAGGELTGTKIEILNSSANIPLCMFYAVPPEFCTLPGKAHASCCADFLFEQLLPAEWWDTLFPITKFERNPFVRICILASENNDSIYFDNTFIKVLNSGNYLDTIIDTSLIVHTSRPTAVVEFMLSLSNGPATTNYDAGDPDMLWCMSPKQGVKDASFYLAPTYNFKILGASVQHTHRAMVTIISRASNINKVKVDNIPVGNLFQSFPYDTMWKYAYVHIDSLDSTIIHRVTSPERVIAYVCKEYFWGGYTCNLSDVSILDTEEPTVYQYKCKGTSTNLAANAGNSFYQWSTGDTTQSIIVTDTGYYKVRYTIPGICNSQSVTKSFYVIDTQNVSWNDEEIKDSLAKCDSTIVHGAPALHYEWATGDTTASIVAKDTGIYQVKETISVAPCQILYRLHSFYVRDFSIGFKLGNDTAICKGDSTWLVAPFKETKWSTGASGYTVNIHDTGIYTAVYIDSCGKEHRDSIEVTRTSDCPIHYCLSLEFPTAFSPNGDGKNDFFRAIYNGPVLNYHLLIYNRWGQQVYETHQLNDSWDGNFNNGLQEIGTYMFICYIECPTGKRLVKGDVALIR